MKKFKSIVIAVIAFFILSSDLMANKYSWNTTIVRFAFVIGSNKGGTDRVNLRYAVSDANAFMKVMKKMGGVLPKNSITLFNPGRRSFISGFRTINRKIKAVKSKFHRVEVIFYYSGHSDENSILLGSEKVSYLEIKKAIKKLPADVHIAILDSCSSGAFTRLKAGRKRSPFIIDTSNNMRGYAFMTSSSADETSQESDRIKSSFFTHYLLTGLRGAADTISDGRITVNEVYQFAYNETLARTEKTLNGSQHANYNIQMTGTGDIIMTDIRKSSSRLVLDEDISGKLFIRDRKKRLVGEFSKPYGRKIEIGLSNGRYSIINESNGKIYSTRIYIKNGERFLLKKNRFNIANKEYTIARGNDSKSKENRKNILIKSNEMRFSGYGAPSVRFSSLDSKFNILIGAKGGFIINDVFVVGGGGFGSTIPIKRVVDGKERNLHLGFGGLLFEYYFFPKELFNLSLGTLIGAGGIGYSDEPDRVENQGDPFFYLEPEIHLLLNITEFFKIGIGGSYRFINGAGNIDISDNDLSGFSFSILFAFGKF